MNCLPEASSSWRTRSCYPLPLSKQRFTLIELLIVISIIAILMVLSFPALTYAKGLARRSFCANNIREISKANLLYHEDYQKLVAAAADSGGANLVRWHGTRSNADISTNFDYKGSALNNYLSGNETIKRCPTLALTADFDSPAYEKGGGGYGYNECIGSQMYFVDNPWTIAANQEGLPIKLIKNPSNTVMFTDSACVVNATGNHQADAGSGRIAENSFSKAPFYVFGKAPNPAWGYAWPTIHFRHNKKSNASWADGHVSVEDKDFSNGTNWEDVNLGWFGDEDNNLFDPF